MKIVLDEVKKEGVLVKKDGTELERYSYKSLINKNHSFEKFKEDIDKFNKTLGMQEEFDDIKKLNDYISIHDWN